ncbi:Endoglucanase-4 [Dactylella cylindrospora]|nr:Endoglucanase-4 [Dactylella cylindrospora]
MMLTRQLDRGPVTNVLDSSIACNKPDGTAWPLSATVKAGGTITFNWDDWPSNYKGPTMTYLAYCSTGNCVNEDPTTLSFFKIDQDGPHSDGTWASEALAQTGSYTITLPSVIKSGSYLLRHEFVNLASASVSGGAQFYPMCANIKITNGGSTSPSPVARFPGAYSSSDPGILIDIANLLNPSSYVFPGPSLQPLHPKRLLLQQLDQAPPVRQTSSRLQAHLELLLRLHPQAQQLGSPHMDNVVAVGTLARPNV